MGADTARAIAQAGKEPDWLERFRPAYDAEISNWVDSLGDQRPTASAWDGYAATVVAEALVRALLEALAYAAQPDALYRGLGDGGFEDVSEPSGVGAQAVTFSNRLS